MPEKNCEREVSNLRTGINFGVIGCGWVARDYGIPAIMNAPNAKLVALCDRHPANLESITAGKKVRRTTDLDEFLKTENLDAIYIATPNDSHRFLTEKCAQSGKHILCEKPMATNFADAESMIEVCAANRVQYATAFDQRFQARHLKLKSLIDADALGAVSIIKIHYACWLPGDWCLNNWRVEKESAGGGAFIDLAPHGIDLAQMLTGEKLTEFACFFQNKIHDYRVDDGAAAIGRFADGTLFSLNVAYNCPDEFPRRTLEVIGSRRMARATNTMGQTAGGELVIIDKTGTREEIFVKDLDDISPFQKQIEVFADCLLNGKAFPYSPAQDLATMKIIAEAMKSGERKIENAERVGR